MECVRHIAMTMEIVLYTCRKTNPYSEKMFVPSKTKYYPFHNRSDTIQSTYQKVVRWLPQELMHLEFSFALCWWRIGHSTVVAVRCQWVKVHAAEPMPRLCLCPKSTLFMNPLATDRCGWRKKLTVIAEWVILFIWLLKSFSVEIIFWWPFMWHRYLYYLTYLEKFIYTPLLQISLSPIFWSNFFQVPDHLAR